MPITQHVLQAFVASPADVKDERELLQNIIHELNRIWSRSLGVSLDLLRWETHTHPDFGQDPQDVINHQISSDYDIFIGIFWGRLGTPTPRAESGTVEEFERAYQKYKSDPDSLTLMMYFKNTPIAPSEVDPEQLGRLQEFKKKLGDKGGLYWEFSDQEEFEQLLRSHLARVIQEKIKELSNLVSTSNSTQRLDPQPTETHSLPSIRDNSKEYTLLRTEGGRLYFLPVQNALWDSTEISLELIPETLDETAFLSLLRNNLGGFHRNPILGFALENDAAWVSPQKVAQTMSGWKINLQKNSAEQDFSLLESITFAGISPDAGISPEQFAEMRARRILLNESLGELPANFQNRTGLEGLANEATLEMFVRGQSLPVVGSPIPHLYQSFGHTLNEFLKFVRLTTVLYLKLSNAVESISQLDFELLSSTQLQVNFKGVQKRRYVNVEPSTIEVVGICPLNSTPDDIR